MSSRNKKDHHTSLAAPYHQTYLKTANEEATNKRKRSISFSVKQMVETSVKTRQNREHLLEKREIKKKNGLMEQSTQ
jgi:hypothetical protein